jgi:hypothetical protein
MAPGEDLIERLLAAGPFDARTYRMKLKAFLSSSTTIAVSAAYAAVVGGATTGIR